MKISEIRIKLMEGSEDRLRAFCSITIDDCFVIRDLKIIDGTSGPFVAMPSRKLTGHCSRCHHKNHLRSAYCNHCGLKLNWHQDNANDSPQKLYADVAHPINSECRERIQSAVIEEFDAELERSTQPGYRSRYDDTFDGGPDTDIDEAPSDGRWNDDRPDLRADRGGESVPPPRGGSPRRPTTSAETRAPEKTDDIGPTSENRESDGGGSEEGDGFGAGIF